MKFNRVISVCILSAISCQVIAGERVIATYFCSNPLVSEESVTLQPSKRIHLLEGGNQLIAETKISDPTIDFLHRKLNEVGLEKTCVKSYLDYDPLNQEPLDIIARITFDFDAAVISKNQDYLLGRLQLLTKHNESRFVIEGHTDSLGSKGYNWNLGLKRSASILPYLKTGDEVLLISSGETSPIDSNFTQQGRANNRRVDIQLD